MRGDKKKAAENFEKEQLKKALDDASSQTRNLLISFLLLLFYVFVSAAGTTHRMLFMPDSIIPLPFLSIGLPITAFYFVAPLLILVLHFDLLFNLKKHAEKLSEWEGKHGDHLTLYPFIFNFLGKGGEKGLIGISLSFISWTLTVLAPLVTLVYIQIRFLPYHSWQTYNWHMPAAMLDMCLIVLYWTQIKITFGFWRKVAQGFVFIMAFTPLFYFSVKAQIHDAPGNILFEATRKYAFIFKTCGLEIIDLRGESDKVKVLYPFALNLDLHEKTLLGKEPGDAVKAYYLSKNEEDKAFLKMGERLDLQGRDFRFANLSETTLTKADLRYAKLQGADLIFAKLQGADLSAANLQGADLSRANLQGANLIFANLQGANLISANLQGADLISAKLQRANLSYAELQRANLSAAKLQGAYLSAANLQGAYLISANLQGADFSFAKLQGANLGYAELQGANLISANLQEADLYGAKLQRANLGYAELQGANLISANLQGAQIISSEMGCAEFPSTGGMLVIAPSFNPPDWQTLYALEKTRPEWARRDYKERIDSIKRRCESPQTGKGVGADFKADSFINARVKIACQNEWVANNLYGFLNHSFGNYTIDSKIVYLEDILKSGAPEKRKVLARYPEIIHKIEKECPQWIPKS